MSSVTPSATDRAGLSRRSALRRLGGVGAAAAAAVAAPLQSEAQERQTAASRSEALVRRLFAVLNDGNVDEMDSFIAPDHIFHACGRPEPIVGRAALKELLSRARSDHGGTPFVLASVVADGAQVAARWTRQRRAHDPETGAPAGETVAVNGQFICRVANGQLVETWNVAYAQSI